MAPAPAPRHLYAVGPGKTVGPRPGMGSKSSIDHLVAATTRVAGRPAAYATGGRGLPVLFLHGWGLDHRAYRRSLKRLTSRGCRVVAPSLPGFGGTAGLPVADRSLRAYASWVAEFLEAVGVDEPLVVVGHSFGGGVATRFAHDHPDRVRYLVLLNSVGDPAAFWGEAKHRITDFRLRPQLGSIMEALHPFASGSAARMAQRVFVENVIHEPLAVAHAGMVALTADLRTEMAALAARDLPVLVLWSDRDGVIPLSAFDTFCAAFGADGHVVAGGHSWLLANPDVFGHVLDNLLHVQKEQHHGQSVTEGTEQLRALLRETTLPGSVVATLLAGVSQLWVLSGPPGVLAADITLCHPRLRADEVRAVARRIESTDTYRLTVVTKDRPGLLAATMSALANEGIWVESASVTTWSTHSLALHAVTVRSDVPFTEARWALIGERLRAAVISEPAPTDDVPIGRAEASRTGEGDGRSVVRVTAPDRLGLLSAICRWFAANDVSVDAADVSTIDGVAHDVFLVRGDCDVDELAHHLSARPRCAVAALTSRLVGQIAGGVRS